MRLSTALALVASVVFASWGHAQTPPVGPLVLRLAPTPRTTALGHAWVAGRDHEVVFYNPAQLIGARAEFDVSVARIGPASSMATFGSAYASGKWSLTLGWGVQAVRFSADAAAPYPYTTDMLLSSGSAGGFSSVFAVGGAIAFRGFRIGAAGKYALESVPGSAGSPSPYRSALVADVGVGRNLWGGVIAGSVQNLGRTGKDGARLTAPRQVLVGWSTTKQAGPLDLGVFTQVTMRRGWTSPGAGLEVGYGWIEGYNVALRVGARRPETTTENPVAFGAAFTTDRLTIEYAVRIFDGGRAAHGVTVRWR
ncbi:MAG: hypothetical protein IMZ67_10115 [Acidobacteria bacterium]|nr:hypothetical protein [Acidobacteriota bacterium]